MATLEDEAHHGPVDHAEETALLGDHGPVRDTDSSDQNPYWDELWGIVKYGAPLLLTQCLQYSTRLVTLFFVGRLGTIELGGTALALMTASITGYGLLTSFATSLDTVMAEAFGSGRPHLVGLYAQRVLSMMIIICALASVLWWFAQPLLGFIIKSERLVIVTASFLRVLIASLPGYAVYEVGKRFVRCQGSAMPILWLLVISAPINVLLHYLFIVKAGWGVQGAAAAMAVSQLDRAVFLMFYIYFSNAKQCWDGFQRRALRNWGPVLALAIPDLIMVEADVLSWEIVTLASSYLSDEELGAQTALGSIMGAAFQIPFPFSIATSFQIASAMGAGLVRRARAATVVAFAMSCAIGIVNVIVIVVFRHQIPKAFTNVPHIVWLAA